MSYFPAFIKLDDMDILIVGGGCIAGEKLKHLLDFTSKIKIISPKINDNMKKMINDNMLNIKYQTVRNILHNALVKMKNNPIQNFSPC